MVDARQPVMTGGCQCGAVRFAIYAKPARLSLCHCRMCQKAGGSPFLALADVPHGDHAWTRGKPGTFRSSNTAERDFCPACGTPLSYRATGGEYIELTMGSFDRPQDLTPAYTTGTEAKLAWVDHIGTLPGKTTEELWELKDFVSHQHPDHDT
ncbi:MAG: aldehyde-activating protein [Proteobacteria bacterium SG_bin9]|nr:MAG: aldehyde-activating protein [Proteobacteria bacterium SG_bin9]